MPVFTNVEGIWREVSVVSTNVNGTWRNVGTTSTNANGIWRSVEEPFGFKPYIIEGTNSTIKKDAYGKAIMKLPAGNGHVLIGTRLKKEWVAEGKITFQITHGLSGYGGSGDYDTVLFMGGVTKPSPWSPPNEGGKYYSFALPEKEVAYPNIPGGRFHGYTMYLKSNMTHFVAGVRSNSSSRAGIAIVGHMVVNGETVPFLF